MKKNKTIYKAAIIGAGKIGSGFDDAKSPDILTHAHAFYSHPKTELVALSDTDFPRCEKEAKKWRTRAYGDWRTMMKELSPEIVVVAVPDLFHFAVLKEISRYNPKLIICEKPVTTSVKETAEIMDLYKKQNIAAIVNYRRRFDQTVQKFREKILSGKYGKIVIASAIYGKGLLHSGSHMIDLARYLFGEVKHSEIISPFSFADDCKIPKEKCDKTVGVFISFEKCPQFYLLPNDERNFTLFELSIVFEKAVVSFLDEGRSVEVRSVQNDPMYKGYRIPGKSKVQKTKLSEAMLNLADNAALILDGSGEEPVCGIKDALETQKVCEKLLNKFYENEKK